MTGNIISYMVFPVALRSSNFRKYLFGASISETGTQMQNVAVAWQVYEITNNPASLGLIGLANFLPIILFSLVGGVVADKHDRKIILITGQALMGIVSFMLFFTTVSNTINPWLIYVLLALSATANSFANPARQSILPHLVDKERFLNAVSLNTLQHQAATMVGPAIAGLLIAGFGVASVYLFNTISFVIFIASLLIVRVAKHTQNKEISLNIASIMEGVKFVASTPILYTTMILDFMATFFGTAMLLMPVFAKDVLNVGPEGLGLLYASPSIGAVIAGLIVSSMHNIKHQGKVILIAVFIYGLATLGFGLSKFLPLSLAFLMIMGAGDMVSTVIRNTIRQMVTPDHLRGRMVSVMRIFFQGGPQLGEMEAGLLASVVGAPISVVIGGLGTLITTTVIAYSSKSLRNYKGSELKV